MFIHHAIQQVINSISFPDYGIALILAVAAGLIYASILYFRENKFSNPPFARSLLAFLRGCTVSLIIILLFGPVIKSMQEEIKPARVIMARDVSASMKNTGLNQTDFQEKWDKQKEDLATEYDVKDLEFGTSASEEKLDSSLKKSTNFAELFKFIDNNYADQNVGAVVISSDGIYNEGSNPLYLDAFINTPLYIVAGGDTTRYKDLMVSNVFYNKIAYLGDKFTLQIDLKAYNAINTSSRLVVESGGKNNIRKRWEENIQITGKDFFTTKTIELDASETGLTKFKISLIPLGDEKNKSNNYKDIFVEILDGRQKVLLLANSPHPDVAAIRQLTDQNKNYEIKVAYAGDPIPNLGAFDLVVLHNLPSEKFPVKNELSVIASKKIPVYYVLGMQTSLPLFNQAQDIISVTGNSKNNEEIQVETAPSFTTYTISETLKNAIRAYPPLLTPFGEYKIKGNATVYSYQTIKKIKTNYPQLVLGESRGSKVSVFCGEGIWKWRLADFVQTKSYENISELLGKSMLWTTTKEDKRKFRVNTGKISYRENEPILVEAQLYNDNYELINDPDASLVLKNEDGKEYTYTFSKSGKSYNLNVGMFPPGTYALTATTKLNNQLQTTKNTFTVESVDLEQQDLVARHDLLRSLVQKHGGKILYSSSLDSLASLIKANTDLRPSIFQSNFTRSMIHYKWICLLLIFLLSIEWFFRRYLGSY